MDKVANFFTKEYIQKLNTIRYRLSTQLKSGYSGARKALGKGNSLEFSDFRSYTLGDDIRRIDWNSYARFDKLFIKLYQEEKQANVNIFFDTSRSMSSEPIVENSAIGKDMFAKIVVASIAYIFMSNSDRVNLFTFCNEISVGPSGLDSLSRFQLLTEYLDNLSFKGQTNLSHSLLLAKNIRLGNGVSIVVSDFFSNDAVEEGLKFLQSKLQHVVLTHILGQEEITPTFFQTGDTIRFVDSETGEPIDITVTADVQKQYEKSVMNFKGNLKSFCDKRGFGYVFASSHSNPLELVNAIL